MEFDELGCPIIPHQDIPVIVPERDASNGFLKTAKVDFQFKHDEVLEIYKTIYNKPNENKYSHYKEDIDPNFCWFKIEPLVSDNINQEDKSNLKTLSEAIALGMKTEEE